MTTATVTYCGVPLSVSYDYVPGSRQTWTDPGYPAMAEMSSVQIAGVEVLDMLSNHQREAVETLILEERGEQDADNAAEAAWQHRQDRLMEEGA